MNGHIILNTNIAVDYWKVKSPSYIHFLTHTHGDHIVNLTSTWRLPIYCSEITANLLVERHGVSESLLNILPVNESKIIEVSASESFTVTTYDANHCPGAVMFYFEGKFGNVFYTGDFRLNDEILQICQNLSEKVDLLYLDNTFCSPKCVFPSRNECLKEIIDIIKNNPNHRVIIGVRKLGKEVMLGQLGHNLSETISVSPERYKLCQVLFDTDVFTPKYLSDGARLITVPMEKVPYQMKSSNKECIGIIPTAIYTGTAHSDDLLARKVFVVPYSDHCNYQELVSFVAALKPFQVKPIVKGGRQNMSCFDRYLTQRPISTSSSQSFGAVKTNSVKVFYQRQLYEQISLVKRKRKIPAVNKCSGKRARGVVYDEDSDDNAGVDSNEACETDAQVNDNMHEVDQTNDSGLDDVNFNDLFGHTEEDSDKSDSQDLLDPTSKDDDKFDSQYFIDQTAEVNVSIGSQDIVDKTKVDNNKYDSPHFIDQIPEDNDNIDSTDAIEDTTEDEDKVDSEAVVDLTAEDDDKLDSRNVDDQTTVDDDKVEVHDLFDQTTEDDDKVEVHDLFHQTTEDDDKVEVHDLFHQTTEDDDKVEVHDLFDQTTEDNDKVEVHDLFDQTTEDDDKVEVHDLFDQITEHDDKVDGHNLFDQTTEYNDKVDGHNLFDQTTEDQDKVDNRGAIDDTRKDQDKVDNRGVIDDTTKDYNNAGRHGDIIDVTTQNDNNFDNVFDNVIDLTIVDENANKFFGVIDLTADDLTIEEMIILM